MRVVIIDDNQMARMALRHLILKVDNIELVGECADALEAYNFLHLQEADVLLLDIEMPGMNGIELTRLLHNSGPVVIFTTSKKEHAVEAFELDVADFLVKPIVLPRFIQAIEKARTLITEKKKSKESVEKKSDSEYVFIRDNGVLIRIAFAQILYMEAMGDYVKIFTEQKVYTIHITLKALEEKLAPLKFLRVHRSYIVALNKIDTIEEGAIYIKRTPIPVADAYRIKLNKSLNLL